MKTEISRVDTALDGVQISTSLDEGRLADAQGVGARRELPLAPTSRFYRFRGVIEYIPRMRNPSKSLQLQKAGENTEIPQVDTVPHGVEPPTHSTGW